MLFFWVMDSFVFTCNQPSVPHPGRNATSSSSNSNHSSNNTLGIQGSSTFTRAGVIATWRGRRLDLAPLGIYYSCTEYTEYGHYSIGARLKRGNSVAVPWCCGAESTDGRKQARGVRTYLTGPPCQCYELRFSLAICFWTEWTAYVRSPCILSPT